MDYEQISMQKSKKVRVVFIQARKSKTFLKDLVLLIAGNEELLKVSK